MNCKKTKIFGSLANRLKSPKLSSCSVSSACLLSHIRCGLFSNHNIKYGQRREENLEQVMEDLFVPELERKVKLKELVL